MGVSLRLAGERGGAPHPHEGGRAWQMLLPSYDAIYINERCIIMSPMMSRLRPGIHRSPRHRTLFILRNEGWKCVG